MNNSIKKEPTAMSNATAFKKCQVNFKLCKGVFYLDLDKSAISACRDDVARKNLEQDLCY